MTGQREFAFRPSTDAENASKPLQDISLHPSAGRRDWAGRLLVVALAVATFAHVVGFEFGGWDDAIVLQRNPRLVQPTLDSLRFYWTNPEHDLWIPVTQTVWWVIAHVAAVDTPPAGGAALLKPTAFHLASVLAHALATVAAFELLRRLPGVTATRATLGAAVFAVHPVQVESVAWAAGLKDVLAGGFGIASLAAYARAATPDRSARTRGRAYALATGLFVAAMLCKPSAVVVPVLAGLIDVLLLNPQRPAWRITVVRLLPWVLLALPVAYVAKRVQPGHQGDYVAWAERVLIAVDALSFYIWKLIWPANLAFDYGRTPQATLANGWHAATTIVPVLAAIAAILWRRWRGLAVGLLMLLAGVFPVLGFVPFDFQIYSTVGDHYLYLAMIGPALLVATLPGVTRRAALLAAGVVIATLAVASHRQAWTWQSLESMSRQALRVNPGSWASYNNLAVAWMDGDALDNAEWAARRALNMKPEADIVRRTLSGVFVRRGDAAVETGDSREAIGQYEQAVEIDPTNAVALTNLAATLAEGGELDRAIDLYERALRFDGRLEAARVGLEMARRIRARQGPSSAPAAP